MRLAVYEPPVDMPVPEVSIYWQSATANRHTSGSASN